MKNSKKVLLALMIAASAGSFSSVSYAELDAGRISYSPTQALDEVSSNLKKADEAIAKGAANDAVVAELQVAKDMTKEVNANDKVAFKMSKARDFIKKAIIEAKNGHFPEASALIKQAISGVADAKTSL